MRRAIDDFDEWREQRENETMPFPYYAPSHYSNVLKESDCLHEMEHLRIPYIKVKLCPLVVPSVCPECKTKFFEMTDDLSEATNFVAGE